jgi:hypothetical protein
LLLTYARLLNPENSQVVQEVRDYRNKLLDVNKLVKESRFLFLKEWKVGEL